MNHTTTPVWKRLRSESLLTTLNAMRQALDAAIAETIRRDAERIQRMAEHAAGTAHTSASEDQ